MMRWGILLYELHKQDMKREMGKGQQTDIDINIDMEAYQQIKLKKNANS